MTSYHHPNIQEAIEDFEALLAGETVPHVDWQDRYDRGLILYSMARLGPWREKAKALRKRWPKLQVDTYTPYLSPEFHILPKNPDFYYYLGE